jgi:hypothetical protein
MVAAKTMGQSRNEIFIEMGLSVDKNCLTAKQITTLKLKKVQLTQALLISQST